MSNATTYTVYSAVLGGVPSVGLVPLGGGPPDAVNGWQAVTGGALVSYPDGSVQLTDVLGNFDSSQSSWAAANASILAVNPSYEPEVQIALVNVAPQNPLDTTIVVAAPNGGASSTAGHMRSPMSSRFASSATVGNELASVQMLPRGVAMFDNETRTFTLSGSDTDGQYVDLHAAQIAWSVSSCNGGAGAGTVTQGSNGDAARAKYTPPASGTFTCPDIVTATVTNAGSTGATTTVSASANAFYYDVSSGVKLTGTLASSSGKPVTAGLVTLYGGGREFYHGNLAAYTNSQGVFARTVPPNRTMTPVGGNITLNGTRGTATYYTLSPSTIAAGAPGTSIAAATYTEGGPFVNPFKPLPPVDRAFRDAYALTGISIDQFPFGRPLASGKYPKCSIDAIVNAQSDSTSCAVVGDNGFYNNWTATKSGSTCIFQQPAAQEGGRHLMQVAPATALAAPYGISDAVTKAVSCTNSACFTFADFYNPIGFTSTVNAPITSSNGALSGAPAGTILAQDGGFAEAASNGGAFTVQYLRNEYTVGHQVQGSPLYAHTQSFGYASSGASSAQISDNWYNAAGAASGTLSLTFTPNPSTGVAWSYTGSGSRSYYKGSSVSGTLQYSISGQQNSDHTAQSTVTITQSPDPNSNGTAIVLNYQAPTQGCPSGYPAPASGSVARICATLANPNVTNLQGQYVAYFTVDPTNMVTVALDPNLAQNTAATFHL
ncbi:MAG: hypothetical protein JO225_04625 [Candidatus Eremiobacteraeota bacterium]|nr:hypothetical protein [Candidatus Eremiobacteraeota bacterium]